MGAMNFVGVVVGGNQTMVEVENGVSVNSKFSMEEDEKLEHPPRVGMSVISPMKKAMDILLMVFIAPLLYRWWLGKQILKDVIIFLP
jgi:hypothetical protein